MLRLMMLAGLATLALSTGAAWACQAEEDPAQLRACGETWSDYAERRQADVERQYRTVDQDADRDQDGGGGGRRRHR